MKNTLLLATLACSIPACTDELQKPDGLSIDDSAPDHVAGTFSRDGVTLVFDFTRDRPHGKRVAELATANGEHLMTSVLAGGVETVNVLDGRLSISGPPDSIEPTIVGDPAAMVEMTETAEIKLLPELRGALSEQGFDDELHTPVREKDPAANVFNPSDGYWHLAWGESKSFATWSAWYPTSVYLRNFSSRCATVEMRSAGSFNLFPLNAYSYQGWTGYWWGFPVTVKNLQAWVDWDGRICGPSEIGAVAY